jgi:predicted RNase H-like HicB family nuclease
MSELPVMTEVVFDVTRETSGGYDAESSTENLSAQGDTWEDLCANIRKVVDHYFHDGPKPQTVRLHHVREEVLNFVD